MRSVYYPQIDGLRGFAVILVVFYHYFPNLLQSGFIGVDIFFTISGFLITQIILRNLASKDFSIMQFYGRRIRRIFPALAVVLASTIIFGYFTLLADEYKNLGKHAAGGAAFISNFLSLGETGYFAQPADNKPLLHLWSLGVEEQFYILYPIALVWLLRTGRSKFGGTLLLFLASLICWITTSSQNMELAYFAPWTRVWEILAGSLIALGLTREPVVKLAKKYSNHAAVAGIVLMICSMLTVSEQNFAGFMAVLPTLAATLLILSSQKHNVSDLLLKRKTLVWFGKISFSLYLWHWPLLAFATQINGERPTTQTSIILICAAISLAFLTWRFVENPIRMSDPSGPKSAAIVLVMLMIGTMGAVIYGVAGIPNRVDAKLVTKFSGDIGHLEFHKFIAENYFECEPKKLFEDSLTWEGYSRCMQSKKGSQIDIALVGDSHAEHLFIGMADSLESKNVVFYIKGSAPLLSNPDFKEIFGELEKSSSVKTIVISMFWLSRISELDSNTSLSKELVKLNDFLQSSGKTMILTNDVPDFPFAPDNCAATRRFSTNSKCSIDRAGYELAFDGIQAEFDRAKQLRSEIRILDTRRWFCEQGVCGMEIAGKLMYRDNHHLNINGSKYLGTKIKDNYGYLFQ